MRTYTQESEHAAVELKAELGAATTIREQLEGEIEDVVARLAAAEARLASMAPTTPQITDSNADGSGGSGGGGGDDDGQLPSDEAPELVGGMATAARADVLSRKTSAATLAKPLIAALFDTAAMSTIGDGAVIAGTLPAHELLAAQLREAEAAVVRLEAQVHEAETAKQAALEQLHQVRFQ